MSSAASRPALILTNAAKNRIRQICKNRPDVIGLRIGTKQRGCSGYSYNLEYATQRDKTDIEVVEQDVRVFINIRAQMHVIGSTMDYRDDKLSSEFVFDNPNATQHCGCGESFSVRKSPASS